MKTSATILLFTSILLSSSQGSDYVSKMIDCDESVEASACELYDTFIHLLSTKEIEKDFIVIPTSLAIQNDKYVILSRFFYVTPNELRGFVISIPKELTEESDGYIKNGSALALESLETKQGIQLLVLKKGISNQAAHTTAVSAPR